MTTQVLQNAVPIFVIGVIIICVGITILRNRKGLLVKAALYAVTKAEETWGSNTGRIKFAEVYTYLNKQYPIVTFFFTEDQISEIIEDALEQMKAILATKASKEDKETA